MKSMRLSEKEHSLHESQRYQQNLRGKGLRGQSSGIPHLAKNERDVGHPSVGGDGKRKERALMGLRPVFINPRTLVRTWGTRTELV